MPAFIAPVRINTATTADALADALVTAGSASRKPLVVQAAASQTANLQEWQDSTGAVKAAINPLGNLVVGIPTIPANTVSSVLAGLPTASPLALNGSTVANYIGLNVPMNAQISAGSTNTVTGTSTNLSVDQNGVSGGGSIYTGVSGSVTTTGAGTIGLVLGGFFNMVHAGTATITNLDSVRARVRNTSTGTIASARAISVLSATNAGTFTTNYGIFVDAQTVGAFNYGVAIAAAGTQTLWLSSTADNTTAAAGIGFGSSRDTTVYRSGTSALTVGGSLVVTGDYTVTDAKNVVLGTATGTKFGTATTQKMAWWNATPVVQSTGWSVTAGYTASKSFDPETASLLQANRVLGTLVDLLKTYGIVGA